ncbi:MAG TPA: membrane protein insertase YidC [Miltoncostaeaceae bacterium]|nr:membrane protein insertase YidC [Miltoncostaeaceae bacterium]
MNPLQLLEDPLRALLDFLHENAHLTYGWSIVVLTVIVRTAMLPLVIKQYQSMRSMQMVAPQLKELQRKYKGNRQKLNEELMAFYKENEINPFASCLPLVAQIPVFIALYYVLKDFAKEATVSGGSVSFMWLIDDVREDIQEIGWGAIILVAIYGLSQLLSTELSATPNMPESQRRLMRLLPIVVVIFVFQFPVPAGLLVYWMTTNLWTCGQQLVMRHRIGLHLADPEEIAKFEATQKKRGSRTAPKEVAAGLVDDDGAEGADGSEAEVPETATAARTPRRRRRRGAPAEEAAGEPTTAPEPDEAPEPLEAPEPETVEPEAVEPEAVEPEAGTEPASAPGTAPAGAEAGGPNGASGNGRSGGGTARRQPRPKGAAKGSRPAQPSRSKKKKR